MSSLVTTSPSLDSTPPSTPPPELPTQAVLGVLRTTSPLPPLHPLPSRPVNPKTSISHPINISWLLPNEYLPLLAMGALPDHLDVLDLTNPNAESEQILTEQMQQALAHSPIRTFGNLTMSSCPGKKVRLNGPVRGRAAINRDLDLDFARMRSFGITTIVCCLEDFELDYLGASWSKYSSTAKQLGMQVLRLPMTEGSCPDTLEQVEAAVQMTNDKIRLGENVLTHCRGGVGRAGLFACCWLIHNQYCHTAERAIQFVRLRRSPKAIETVRQAEFVIRFAMYIAEKRRTSPVSRWSLDHPPHFATMTNLPRNILDLDHSDATLSVPSIEFIVKLEQFIRDSSLSPNGSHPYT
ncbi:phosphatases II [Hesseltinella vesiculosa]|uniref:Phosphatases II n=1 Tax=Hesseltinella vesiculosa TaxID=101127 RepID=A0A1X2GDW6_9FUNG|nr:phosphatases II [Hesseltinella vesiculosa]